MYSTVYKYSHTANTGDCVVTAGCCGDTDRRHLHMWVNCSWVWRPVGINTVCVCLHALPCSARQRGRGHIRFWTKCEVSVMNSGDPPREVLFLTLCISQRHHILGIWILHQVEYMCNILTWLWKDIFRRRFNNSFQIFYQHFFGYFNNIFWTF